MTRTAVTKLKPGLRGPGRAFAQSLGRHAWLGLLAWLVAAPLVAQENPHAAEELPLSVETLRPEPTVVKTGDRITQRYRVRFPDLVSEGKEIIVLEDRMVPENLPVAPFEGVGLVVEKRQIGGEHIWEFVYSFRIINPGKATYILPNFSVYWLIRDLGQEIEESEVLQSETDPLLIRYVSTITEEPYIDVRDTIRLGDFTTRAATFRTIGWGVAPVPLLLWGIMLVRVARRRKPVVTVKQKEADELSAFEAQLPVPPTLGRARRALRRRLAALAELAPSENGRVRIDVERDLVISCREYLMAELPELNPGDTAKDIRRYVETSLREGSRKTALLGLASQLVAYQTGLERGVAVSTDRATEDREAIEASLARLQPHLQVIDRVRGLWGSRS